MTSRERQDLLQNVPTATEAGFPNVICESWMGLVAPRGTPTEVVNKLSQESRTINDGDDYLRKVKQIGFNPRSSTPDEFAALISSEHARWAPILKSSGLKMD